MSLFERRPKGVYFVPEGEKVLRELNTRGVDLPDSFQDNFLYVPKYFMLAGSFDLKDAYAKETAFRPSSDYEIVTEAPLDFLTQLDDLVRDGKANLVVAATTFGNERHLPGMLIEYANGMSADETDTWYEEPKLSYSDILLPGKSKLELFTQRR